MKTQEVITVVAKVPAQTSRVNDNVTKNYPELAPLFEKGMYIEHLVQTLISQETYIITFVLRYYNSPQANA